MTIDSLVANETIVFESTKHWFAPVRASGKAALLILGAFVIGWISPDTGPGFFGAIGKLLDLLRLALFLGGVGLIVYNLVAWRTAKFAVTNLRVLRDEGIISHRTSTTLMASISDVKTRIGPSGKVLGFGDILVITQSGESGADRFESITRPLEFRQAIMAQRMGDAGATGVDATAVGAATAAGTGTGAPVQPPSATPTITSASEAADLLARLADLRDRGAITPAEFEIKKAELLARM